MYLNTLTPTPGSKKKALRVGRGIGSGIGKTAGRGHKGQKARSGGYHKINFEGGQMPIQRRLPKMGFKSKLLAHRAEFSLEYIAGLDFSEVSVALLKTHDLIQRKIKKVKVIGSTELEKPLVFKGIEVSASARVAIEKAGGRIED